MFTYIPRREGATLKGERLWLYREDNCYHPKCHTWRERVDLVSEAWLPGADFKAVAWSRRSDKGGSVWDLEPTVEGMGVWETFTALAVLTF